ncbi:hypothetical protein B0H17DRAFT_1123891 [Mycena rosella]|uniref:Uncharacterized protein n=1 Tax=Mycena rosella TaxID=1033263 RepID=A0AAD7H373_MYCRO|nr:hypothetical protein B0H17DRAFT_1123891 [Mycena rosella]
MHVRSGKGRLPLVSSVLPYPKFIPHSLWWGNRERGLGRAHPLFWSLGERACNYDLLERWEISLVDPGGELSCVPGMRTDPLGSLGFLGRIQIRCGDLAGVALQLCPPNEPKFGYFESWESHYVLAISGRMVMQQGRHLLVQIVRVQPDWGHVNFWEDTD